MARTAALVAGLLLIACAAPGRYGAGADSRSLKLASRDSGALDRDDDVSCSYEAPTGSHIRKPKCETARQRNDKRMATQDSMRWLRTRMTTGRGTAVVDDYDLANDNVNVP